MLTIYQVDPKEIHLIATNRIIKYIKGWSSIGIWYYRDSIVGLKGYIDSDWTSFCDDWKIIVEWCFYIGHNHIIWNDKKPNLIALFTVEAKDVVVSGCCSQLLWLRQMLEDYGTFKKIPIVYYDITKKVSLTF